MKVLFTFFLAVIATALFAQTSQKQAIIKTKTTCVSPDGEEWQAPPPPSDEGGERRIFMRLGGDGETVTTTYYKNGLTKTIMNTEMMNMSIIRDNANKKTTTLMEVMGTKTATVATDEESEQMRKQMDSMMQANPQFSGGNRNNNNATLSYDVVLQDGTKKIAGVECKKAMIVGTRSNGTKDSSYVWYNPSLLLDGLNSTGGQGGGGFGSFMRNNMGTGGFDKLPGFPMMYERKMNRGRTMTVEVTKIDTEKEIKDSEFEIPKDYKIQSAKDAQRQMGGRPGMQIRIGG